jgi:hypothetical protein
VLARNHTSDRDRVHRLEGVMMLLHTIPFFCLQLGLLSVSYSNISHGLGPSNIWSCYPASSQRQGYWFRLGLVEVESSRGKALVVAAHIYQVLLLAVVLFKIIYCLWSWINFMDQLNSGLDMSYTPPPPPQPTLPPSPPPLWEDKCADTPACVALFVDYMFLVLAFLIPFLKTIILAICYRQRLDPVLFRLQPHFDLHVEIPCAQWWCCYRKRRREDLQMASLELMGDAAHSTGQ